ncbi:protein of unknown function [Streptomyces murinus]
MFVKNPRYLALVFRRLNCQLEYTRLPK